MSVSLLLPILVTVSGLFLLFKLRFFFLVHPLRTLREFLYTLKEKENRTSLCLALAGTLGVGNIFGVCAGLVVGGAGSVFWLLVSSLFSSVIKYSETVLSADTLSGEHGGMHLVLKLSFKKLGGTLAPLYASLCLSLAFFMGAAVQSRAAYGVSSEAFGTDPRLFAVLFSILILVSVIGGGDKIEKISSYVIPLTTIIYILLAFSVIVLNFSKIGGAVRSIFFDAFSPRAGVGGVLGFFAFRGLKEGFARGILSNEAGIGTSSMAHSRAKKREVRTAGLYGICEVFFDTVVLCPLTALAVLVSVGDPSSFSSPMSLISSAVESSLGGFSLVILTLCILSFAYSTVSCWFYYGSECMAFLFSGKLKYLFMPIYLAFIFIGVFSPDFLILSFTDVIILLMSFITLTLLLKESNRIKKLTFK